MTNRARPHRPQMYSTPPVRNMGLGALQVEALSNPHLSIARRHLAASQLRMRAIEPEELSSSEWVRFLVMEERERDRWITMFRRRRRNSEESNSDSVDLDSETAQMKAEEARLEAVEAQQAERAATGEGSSSSATATATATDPDAPPSYSSIIRAHTPPPAYEPR